MTPLDPDRLALAADPRHLRLARHLARRASSAVPWLRDEIESAAMLGLVHAAARFDPAMGFSFVTIAHPTIRGAIRTALVRARHRGFRSSPAGSPLILSLQEPIADAAGEAFGDHERALIEDADPPGADLEYQDWVEALARRVPPHAATAFRLRYSTTRTMAAIGAEAGVDPSAVSHRLARAIGHLAALAAAGELEGVS